MENCCIVFKKAHLRTLFKSCTVIYRCESVLKIKENTLKKFKIMLVRHI